MTEQVLSTRELRQFGFIMSAIIVLLFALLLPWIFNNPLPLWPWILAAVFAVPALLFPPALAPVYRVWMRFGHIMGWINTRIILAIMFYLIILPVGIIMRIVRYDPMRRDTKGSAPSYRIESHSRDIKNDLEKPF